MLGRRLSLGLRPSFALLALALLGVAVVSAQHRPRSPPHFPPRPDYGRIGLCPYVERVIPETQHDPHRHLGSGDEPPSLCGNFCTSDQECPDTQKCCPNHCGYSCFDPVFIAE